MVCEYLQLTVNYDRVKHLLNVRHFGSFFSDLENLQRLGVNVTLHDGDIDLLEQCFDVGLPVLIALHTSHLKSYWIDEVGHAVVAIGMDEQFIYVNDPAFADAPKAIDLNEFIPAWDEKYNLCAVISLE